jgi:hypothetical protein
MQPLDTRLNVAIIHIASKLFPLGFDVSEQAPSTLEELKGHLADGKRMLVYKGGSDRTIYGDPEVNWCFRAWHDWCHWRGEHDLTHDGEQAVCAMQNQHLLALYGSGETLDRFCKIIDAEVIGQAEYYRYHKRFPDDQHGFVKAYLECPGAALMWPRW